MVHTSLLEISCTDSVIYSHCTTALHKYNAKVKYSQQINGLGNPGMIEPNDIAMYR